MGTRDKDRFLSEIQSLGHRVPCAKNSNCPWMVIHFFLSHPMVSSVISIGYSHRKFELSLSFLLNENYELKDHLRLSLYKIIVEGFHE